MPTILITGASQGMGRAAAQAFAALPDARLALVARNEERLRETCDLSRAHGAEARPFPCDVADEAAVEEMAASVRASFGVPDIVLNNAGLFETGPVVDMTVEAFSRQVAVNLTSAFMVTRVFLRDMLERGSGHLFYMCSVASLRAYPGAVAYCAAKHGVLGLARAMREETRAHGVRVTAVLPGATWTPSWYGSGVPAERLMPPEDIAQAILDVWRMSDRTVVEELLLRPQEGDIP